MRTLLTYTELDFTTTYTIDANVLTCTTRNDALDEIDTEESITLTSAQLKSLKTSVDTDSWSSLGYFFHCVYAFG